MLHPSVYLYEGIYTELLFEELMDNIEDIVPVTTIKHSVVTIVVLVLQHDVLFTVNMLMTHHEIV
jgi:hypothetical protein